MASAQTDPATPPVAAITGATAGIGRATALGLAGRGYRLVLIGRDAGRLDAAATAMRAAGATAVETVLADLAVQAEIRRAAGEIRERHPQLDVLVNNAGAMFDRRRESIDGIEMTLAVNHIAYVLLTRELEAPLAAAGGGRVVWVASGAHRRAKPEEDWQSRHRYRAMAAYCRSKLANVMTGYAYARRLADRGVTLNTLHPGFVSTDIGVANRAIPGFLWALAVRFGRSPEDGARTSLALATDPSLAGVTGRYFDDGRPATSSPASLDPAAQDRVLAASLALIGEEGPR